MKWVRDTDDSNTFTMVVPGGVLYRYGHGVTDNCMVFVPYVQAPLSMHSGPMTTAVPQTPYYVC